MRSVVLIIWGVIILGGVRYFILKNYTPQKIHSQKSEDLHFLQEEDDINESIATEVDDFFKYYFVKPGETLPQIAKRYKINIKTLISLNNLKSHRLSKGQVLVIPKIDGITYKIKKNENLGYLSKKFGISIADIKRVNSLDSNIIREGNSLYLPGVKYFYIQQENNLKKRKHYYSKNRFKTFKKIRKKYENKYEKIDYSLNYDNIDYSLNSEGFIFPTIGRVSSKFGNRKGRFHSGIDISGPIKSPIYAAESGIVKYAGWMGNYGKVIIIAHENHENNYTTLYGHNLENFVKEGDIVKKGQVIGLMGRSGNATGNHLHFEIRKNGKSINPLSIISKVNK